MTEIILALVIGALLVLLGWKDHTQRKERSKLLNALISKDAKEMRDLELVDKVEVEDEPEEEEPDIVPLEDIDDDEFNEVMEKEHGKKE